MSIANQIEAARKTIEGRGWELHCEPFIDDGVSAIKLAARDRPGFRELEQRLAEVDLVVIHKVDRLARNARDFHTTVAFLQDRGVRLVSVADSIDLTTPQGRAFASILATMAELEAEYIRERYTSARHYAISQQRLVGGAVPYGWRRELNPNGSGYVLGRDPERAPVLREMADRALRGESLSSIRRWLDQEAIPPPGKVREGQPSGRWTYNTLERLLRNPRLAGLTPYQPGRTRHQPADDQAVLRDSLGRPVINPASVIVTLDERERLLDLLNHKPGPQARPRSTKRQTSPFLAQAVHCGHCNRFMTRKTLAGRPALGCPECQQSISRPQLEAFLVDTLLSSRGNERTYQLLESTASQRSAIAELDNAINHLTDQLKRPGADVPTIAAKLRKAGEELAGLRQREGDVIQEWLVGSDTLNESWAEAESDEARRDLLLAHMSKIEIRRGKTGRYLDKDRVVITWAPEPPEAAIFLGLASERLPPGRPLGQGSVGTILLSAPDGPGRQRFWG